MCEREIELDGAFVRDTVDRVTVGVGGKRNLSCLNFTRVKSLKINHPKIMTVVNLVP